MKQTQIYISPFKRNTSNFLLVPYFIIIYNVHNICNFFIWFMLLLHVSFVLFFMIEINWIELI